MTEYVDREKVLEELHNVGGCDAEPGTWADGYDKAINLAYDIVRKMPAADVAPVRHGEWIDRYGGRYDNPMLECSVCGNIALYRFGADCLRSNRFAQYRSGYCPRCGAKMDLGGNDNG